MRGWKRCVTVLICALCLTLLGVLACTANRDIEDPASGSLSVSQASWTAWLKDALTVAAIVVGAAWTYMLFVHTRQKYPRLNLKPIVSVHGISDSERLLRFGLELENVGNVLASLRECEVWIQQLKPWPEEVLASIKKMGESVNGTAEAGWPLICERKLCFEKGGKEIEPGEKDEIWFDFIIVGDVEAGLVYAHVRNEHKKRTALLVRREIGWNITATFTVRDDERRASNGRQDGLERTEREEAGNASGPT